MMQGQGQLGLDVGCPSDACVARVITPQFPEQFIRSRREPKALIEVGAAAVSGPHLANIAFLQRRRATFE
jgi:hypothetical protein